jgi:hypothetical protein
MSDEDSGPVHKKGFPEVDSGIALQHTQGSAVVLWVAWFRILYAWTYYNCTYRCSRSLSISTILSLSLSPTNPLSRGSTHETLDFITTSGVWGWQVGQPPQAPLLRGPRALGLRSFLCVCQAIYSGKLEMLIHAPFKILLKCQIP